MTSTVVYRNEFLTDATGFEKPLGSAAGQAGKQMEKRFTTHEARWEAVRQRDAAANGHFFYGVKTTGVYCRPTCSSRRPRVENVQFFESGAAAEAAGFRPCKRCQPQSPTPDDHAALIERACESIAAAPTPPSLDELAAAAGLSPSYFHRLFKAKTGVTPKQYALAHRHNQLHDRLQQDDSITEAMYNAGYGSSSRFYEQSTALLGMKPSQFRRGAAGQQIQFAITPCYLGWVLVAGTDQGICAIELGDTPEGLQARLQERFPLADLQEGAAAFRDWVQQVLIFLKAPGDRLDLPLDIQGTAFQRRVWLALRDIPAGTTLSYSAVAARIGQPKATRAVAQACASNKLAVAIPCHRVVRQDGDLGGYRWGIPRKQALLGREAQAAIVE